ncbi:MAG: ferritin-like domain-containing protein [Frankiaceae bacterium]|nr:ferritin-like domain-containing protein [Frankiaceae bacterium]
MTAWQAALAAEHQAVYGYGLLGPYLQDATARTLAVSCFDAHGALVAATSAALAAAGQEPVGPLADYPGLPAVQTDAQARALAARLEDECAQAWRYLYAQDAQRRTSAQQGLTASAVRAARWRGTTSPFPGLA